MAQKVAVLGENRHVKRSIADLLVRRLTHEPVMALVGEKLRLIGIKALPLREYAATDPRLERPCRAPRPRKCYEHHIEPRFETISPIAHELSYEYIKRWAR